MCNMELQGLYCRRCVQKCFGRKLDHTYDCLRSVNQETMDNGVSLLVYPEGTSTDGKNGMLPFKSTVFSSLPPERAILPTVLVYHEFPANGVSAAWGDDAHFGSHVWEVLGLKKVVIDLYILPEMFAEAGEDRKSLASRVREKMLAEYYKHA